MAEKSQISAPLSSHPSRHLTHPPKEPQPLCPNKQVAGREDREVSGQVSHERVCIQGTDGDPDRQVHRCTRQTDGEEGK